jgi:hypothetical protein
MTLYNFNDAWAMIWNDTKPLVGKIEFCEANTTSLKTIYTVDGQELSNPIYCNGITTSQVMLADGDYTVRFYEYIGHGNMESDYNEDSWRLYKTELVKQNILNGGNDTTGVYATITTIEQLKEMEVPSDGSVVGVVGYYTAEDCPLRYYVWHESGNYVDDGGIVIKSNNVSNGAWVMKIPYNYIDVRWYGDIPSNLVSAPSSNLGQRTKAATAANKYRKDLYFPSYAKGSETGFYMFDGSNTVSVDKDIIVDNAVRFVVKHGTEGTQVTCHELKACEKYLFVSELGQTAGGYHITADTINTSWYDGSIATASGARVKYVIDRMSSPLTFNDAYVELAGTTTLRVVFDNCHVDGFKKLSGPVEMSNMLVKTEWFVDDYDWSQLSLYNCQIELENCKDANTYILLKTKQNDPNYGDLGEQNINATVLAGGTIENCYGTITVSGTGSIEFHNVSLTVNGLTTSNNINAVDSWLTFGSAVTIGSLQLRRGSLSGSGLTLIQQSYIENATINVPINTTGIKLIVRNSDINQKITTRNIDLINNQIYAEIDQSDYSGVVYVNLSGNMFHGTAQHYVHADTADSIVQGGWTHNGSSYDDRHWIKLDRTNLQYQDNMHNYFYIGNSEPYLQKWSGRNRPMSFKKYGGYWTSRQTGTGIFGTTTIPFVFLNYRDRRLTVVPRYVYWKTFSVGRGFLARSGRIMAYPSTVGIMESDYVEHKNGNVPILYTWGCQNYHAASILNDKQFGAAQMVSRDADGIAEYNVSFEPEDQVHGEYSYGMLIGFLPSSDFDSGSDRDSFVTYPAQSNGNAVLFVMMDPDFSTGTNPVGTLA